MLMMHTSNIMGTHMRITIKRERQHLHRPYLTNSKISLHTPSKNVTNFLLLFISGMILYKFSSSELRESESIILVPNNFGCEALTIERSSVSLSDLSSLSIDELRKSLRGVVSSISSKSSDLGDGFVMGVSFESVAFLESPSFIPSDSDAFSAAFIILSSSSSPRLPCRCFMDGCFFALNTGGSPCGVGGSFGDALLLLEEDRPLAGGGPLTSVPFGLIVDTGGNPTGGPPFYNTIESNAEQCKVLYIRTKLQLIN
jgi:hypothetical protein